MNIWSRLGISVAIVAAFSIIMTEVFQSKGYYETFKWHICAAFLATGFAAWLTGRIVNARIEARARARSRRFSEGVENEPSETTAVPMLLNLAYWGPMLFVFGIIIIFIVPYHAQKVPMAEAKTNRAVPAPLPVKRTNAPPVKAKLAPALALATNAFPQLRLQGIVYRLPDPSVLINGRTYFIGDTVEEARVVAIHQASATLAWRGQFRVLDLKAN